MLEFFFDIQGSFAPVSNISGGAMLLVTLPVLLIILAVNIRRRTGMIRTLFWIALAVYISALIELLLFPIPIHPSEFAEARTFSDPVMNMLPLFNIIDSPFHIVVRNLVGNMILFVPLGFFVSFFGSEAKSTQKSILIIATIAFSIEAIQYIGSFIILQMNWKIADIDDVIMNILGGILGLTIYWILDKIFGLRQATVRDVQPEQVRQEVNK